jgi:drug/metabolite transporter (DMT)-like permease
MGAVEPPAPRSQRSWLGRVDPGMAAMVVAVAVFSVASTLVKWAGATGSTVAFWRMLGASTAWWVVLLVRRAVTGRAFPSSAVWRSVAPAGLCFGVNLSIMFIAFGETSIAHAEFINALSPLLLVPVGAVLFGERPERTALPFGLVTLVGLAVVLFNGAPGNPGSWHGDVLVAVAVCAWASYLVAGRRARARVDVVDFMATMMPVGFLVAAPVGLARAGGGIVDVSARGWFAIVLLSLLTGMLAHGMVAFAQRRVDIGTIGVIQVGQPAVAVGWAVLLLGEPISVRQLPGMALVAAGLVGFIVQTRRHATAPAPVAVPAPVTAPPAPVAVCPATD